VKRLLLALLAFACIAAAQAQGLPAASGPGTFISVGAGYSFVQADYGQRTLGGGMAFVDIHPTWRFGLEGEARLLRMNTSEGVTESTYLAGPHIYIRPGRLRPYVKILAGAGKISFPFGYGQGTYFAYAPGVGVDYLVNDRWSLRLIDMEYQQWPQFTFGTLHPYGASAGIVFRINKVDHYATR
jgi:opacity protein-like surface antigen